MICCALVAPDAMSVRSWVIDLPTTSYGDVVIAPSDGSFTTGPSSGAAAPPQAGTATFTIRHDAPAARSLNGGAAARAAAFAPTAATCDPAAGVGPPPAGARVSLS